MSLIKPAKLLPIRFNLLSPLAPDSGGLQYQFNAKITSINPQIHSDSRENNSYDLTDVNIGDYVATGGAGKLMKIVTISSQTAGSISVIVEDELRLNQLQDTTGNSTAYIDNGEGILFEVKDGKPILFPYTNYSATIVGFVKDYAAEIFSRFNYLRHDSIVTVEQASPVLGATAGDLISYDQTTGNYKLLTDTDKFIGVVVEPANPTSTTFRFNPVGSIVTIQLPAPQNVGDRYYYFDNNNPGKLTTTEPADGEWNLPAFFKIDENTAISFEGARIENDANDFVTISTDQTITGTKTFAVDQIFQQDISVGGDINIAGDFTVNGTTTTVNTTNTTITDQLIELNHGYTGPPMSADSGIVINRGPEDNVFFGWDESSNEFTVGTGTFDGSSTGNLFSFDANVRFGNTHLTGAITVDNFNESRVVTVGANGQLTDNDNLTFDGTTLTTKGGIFHVEASSDADVSHTMYVLYNTTNNNTPTALFTDGSAGTIQLSANSSALFEADIVGRNTGGVANAGFKISGLVTVSSGTALIVNQTSTSTLSDGSNWSVATTVNAGTLVVTVTGDATNIRWSAFVKLTEIQF